MINTITPHTIFYRPQTFNLSLSNAPQPTFARLTNDGDCLPEQHKDNTQKPSAGLIIGMLALVITGLTAFGSLFTKLLNYFSN